LSGAERQDLITVRLWGLAALLLCCAAAAPGAQFSSGVNLVEVYASVTDAAGEPIKGLTQADFEVKEDGRTQAISNFVAGDFPLSVAIALDRSFSVAGKRLDLAKVGARVFLEELRPSDQSMVIAIGSQVEALGELSTDRRTQIDALAKVDSFGTTALHDAIVSAIDAVQPAHGRRALVLLSDGDDRYSRTSASAALDRARRSDVMVYPVALGKRRPGLFAELATLTGGRSFHARDAQKLPETLRLIARDLRYQYLLGYAPSKAIVKGEEDWRSIQVTVRRPGARVRARDGYVAK
jgi:Ca-activated chloride channel homolog